MNRARRPGRTAPTGAKRAPFPHRLGTQLATVAPAPPEGDDWVHEIKYDGYRILSFVRSGSPRLISRTGKDWTAQFTLVEEAIAALRLPDCVLDGEVAVVQASGRTSFHALQQAVDMGDRAVRLQYILFDLPYFNGYDLRQCPLLERKAILRQVLADAGESDVVRYGDHIQGDGAHVFEQVRRMRLEGVVSKLASSPYVSARTRSWLKIKAMLGQEFVVIGFTDPQGSRIGFGALLLGYYEGPDLVFCGRVGTGFSDSELRSLSDSLKKLEVRETPAARGPLEEEKGSHWVQPQIVCQVAFAEWTDDGHLRHPSFEGLRLDKAPREVVRDTPV